MLEQFKEEQIREIFDSNVFGVMWVFQVVLPLMRKQIRLYCQSRDRNRNIRSVAGSCKIHWFRRRLGRLAGIQ